MVWGIYHRVGDDIAYGDFMILSVYFRVIPWLKLIVAG